MSNTIQLNMNRLSALKSLRGQHSEIENLIKELSRPVISDLSLLPQIYDIYTDYMREQNRGDDVRTVSNRKKFLMAVLYLYSPASLVGERMHRGLRKKISEVFGLATSSPISDNSVGLIIQYNAYSDFRTDVNGFLSAIATRMPLPSEISI